jgi:serine O-acetyltransferase
MNHEDIWTSIRTESQEASVKDRTVAKFLDKYVLCHATLEEAISHLLSVHLACQDMEAGVLSELFSEAMRNDLQIGVAIRADLAATRERDPAASGYLTVLLHMKGFHAVQTHRVAHWVWLNDRAFLAHFLQNRSAVVFGTDIHPAARIGKGILLDHATGFVVGETAVIGDNVSILHEVTLGGTGKETGDRHPKVRDWVMIGAGAKLLGNIVIGEGAKIGAGSVVLADVPPHTTVAGVPAKVVGHPLSDHPSQDMDQSLRT